MKMIWGVMNLIVACAVAEEQWTLDNPRVWARDANAIVQAVEGKSVTVTHTGRKDWSLYGIPRIAVKPGEIFELSCALKIHTGEEWANVATGVILRDGNNKELSWSYGGLSCNAPHDETELKSRFIIPQGVASIEARLIGHAPSTVKVSHYRIARAGTLAARMNAALPKQVTLAGNGVSVAVDCAAARISVTDTRTGRVWSQGEDLSCWMVLDAVPSPDNTSVALKLLDPETAREIGVALAVGKGKSEVSVELSASGELPKALDFPLPFATRKGDRLIVPMNEGMGYPVDEEHQGLYRMIAYGGHGICMGFFGVTEDTTGAGWMCILETPDDAAMNARKGANGFWQAGPSWDATKGQFGYVRKARYVFFDKGGHVAMCKRYREHAKQVGLFKPFTEKVKSNPKIDLLIGAANIWNWDAGNRKAELVAELQAAGMDRILWSGGGKAEELKALNALPKVLTGRYDIYQDIMDPANFVRFEGKHSDWVSEAFPQDINWAGPGQEQWRRGWRVKAKDGAMIPCAVICDSKALPYARKRISEELKTKPYGARFIDTTVAAPWFECYHPDHPMTRSQSRQHKMELLKLIGDLGLVCGSETGHEASVPFCDYFEGMLSLGAYRVPDSGRDMARVWDEVPARLEKYQVGEAYRLPLWELVYHDCVVAQWYWGDYNNKLPKVWRKRDLFNALYGTPPMYMFSRKQWSESKETFAASYRVAEPVSRATGYSEMTDHRVLTPDRHVQQTVFANGVTVTVNFGGTPYRLDDGTEIAALSSKVTGL